MERQVQAQLVGGLALALAGLVGLVVLTPARILAGIAGLADRPLLFGPLLVGLYTCRSVVLWPISALSVLVGFVFGPVVGIPIGIAGAVYTCLPPYLLARYAPRESGPLSRVHDLGQSVTAATGDLRGLTAARLIPLPADGVSYAAGLAGVGPRNYVLGTALGETPWVTATVMAGASMRAFALDGTGETVPLIVAATTLGLVLLSGPLYRQLRQRGLLEGPRLRS